MPAISWQNLLFLECTQRFGKDKVALPVRYGYSGRHKRIMLESVLLLGGKVNQHK